MIQPTKQTFREALKNVEHHKALGWTDIYLGREDEKPWELVTGVSTGGLHRLSIPVSVDFSCDHPIGLHFRWNMDLERDRSNGKSNYDFDTEQIALCLAALSQDGKRQFHAILKDVMHEPIVKQANEFQRLASELYGAAETLRMLASPPLQAEAGAE